MKKSLLFFSGLAIAALISACSMTNEVHFNKDYSGTFAMYVDMGGVMEMAKSFDPSMEDEAAGNFVDEQLSKEDQEKMIQNMNQIDGISNTAFGVIEESGIQFMFDFEDIESLNNAFTALQSELATQNDMMEGDIGGMPTMGTPQFTKNGKTISHGASFPMDEIPEEALSGLDELGGDAMMEMMMGMMDYSVVLSFDRKIKSVTLEGADLISQDKHVIKARIDLANMIDGGAYKIDVKTN